MILKLSVIYVHTHFMCVYMHTFWDVGVHMSKCVCHLIMCTVCVYTKPSLLHYTDITADADDNIFIF